MDVKGNITRVMEVQTGSGSKGQWFKQSFILEQPGQFPKPVCLDLWGKELIEKYDLESAVGITVTAHINLESREYSGRWYTDVRAWKLEWDVNQKRKWQPGGQDVPHGTKGTAAIEEAPKQEEYKQPDLGSGPLDTTDDLPF